MKCNYNGCSSKCKGDIDVESCNVLRAYQQGAREFAEWIDNNINIGIYDYFGNKIRANDLLAEWQKSKQ